MCYYIADDRARFICSSRIEGRDRLGECSVAFAKSDLPRGRRAASTALRAFLRRFAELSADADEESARPSEHCIRQHANIRNMPDEPWRIIHMVTENASSLS